MSYSEQQLEDRVERWGEVFVVLESDREYEIHGTESYEITNDTVRVEGARDGEIVIAEFPLDAIEHTYTHREV